MIRRGARSRGVWIVIVGTAWAGTGAAARFTSPSTTQMVTTTPVLLVPGWFDTDRAMAALRIRMVATDWPADRVLAVSFDSPTGSNREHAVEIGRAVSALRDRSGADRVDIVAHSMGGLATRLYLNQGGASRVRRVVFLATPHRGTYSSYLAWGGGAAEMRPGSPFLDSLNASPPLPEGVRGITIRTLLDAHIIPGESATLPPLRDYRICCPTHEGLLQDQEVFRIIRRFLGAS